MIVAPWPLRFAVALVLLLVSTLVLYGNGRALYLNYRCQTSISCVPFVGAAMGATGLAVFGVPWWTLLVPVALDAGTVPLLVDPIVRLVKYVRR